MSHTRHFDLPGTDAWHARRSICFNAGDAAAMLACSAHKTRDQLLHELSTGIQQEFSDYVQDRVIDPGHRIEELARSIAEEIATEDLQVMAATLAVEGISRPLGASLDGTTFLEDTNWECKRANEALREALPHSGRDSHELNDAARLPKMYRVQMEQQQAVNGATRTLFTAAEFDDRGNPTEERHCWYVSDPALRAEIIAGWKQFGVELASYVPPAAEAPAPVGKAPEALPALFITVKGEVTASNLAEFKTVALTAIRSVNRDLKTDQDFADSAKARKWCDDIEASVEAAKKHALSQTATIDMLFKTMDEISEEAREVRLALEKLERSRKESRKGEIVAGGIFALSDHIQACNSRFTRPYMPALPAAFTDFGGAIKGKSSFANMQSAVNDLLAKAKIEANRIADGIDANVKFLNEQAGDMYRHLFADVATIVLKASDDFHTLVNLRITEHKAAEQKRLDDERERIRKEEQERADREARERIAREQQEEAARQAAAAPAPAPTPAPAPIAQPVSVTPAPQPVANVVPIASPRPAANEVASLSLGKIGERLGFSLPAEFLALLGIQPAARERAARLYTETQYDAILAALGRHIQQLQQKKAA